MNPLFAIPVHIKPLEGSEMPQNLLGAYLICYSASPDHLTALDLAVKSLAEDHYLFIGLNGKISELDTDFWQEYVAATWSEEKGALPLLEDIRSLQKSGGVLYSPFCCYDTEEKSEPAS